VPRKECPWTVLVSEKRKKIKRGLSEGDERASQFSI